MAVQLAYHGTKAPISQIQSQGFRTGNLKSIAPGQVFMSNNPAFSAGYGNTIKMAAPKSTFSLPSKNLATGAWGKELITSPKAATKMMNLANYAEGLVGSPTAKKFLSGQTVSGLGKRVVNTLAGKTLGGLGFLFDATPANADEINMTVEDFQNLALQNQTQPIDPTGKNLFTQYGYEEDPYAGIEGQTAGLNIPLALKAYLKNRLKYGAASTAANLALEAKAKAAEKKAAEEKAAAARKKQQQATIAAKGTAQGSGGTFVDKKTGAMKGYEKGAGGGKDAPSQHFYIARGGLAQRAPRYANGGLINFFKYGGYLG